MNRHNSDDNLFAGFLVFWGITMVIVAWWAIDKVVSQFATIDWGTVLIGLFVVIGVIVGTFAIMYVVGYIVLLVRDTFDDVFDAFHRR